MYGIEPLSVLCALDEQLMDGIRQEIGAHQL
jgi:hypothetical protein